MSNGFSFAPKFSLEPGKISFYTDVLRHSADGIEHNLEHSDRSPKKVWNWRLQNGKNLTRQFHNFEISHNAARNLRRKINWLYYLAKKKSITTYSGKKIYNFKMCFLTLTLPSKQQHCTRDFTNLFFNQFLTEIRDRTDMKNYVWRLEFQKNGNVHYHLCSDVYLDYFFVRKIWNRIIDKAGYVAPYTEKFKNLPLSRYREIVDPEQKTDYPVIAKRYARGCKLGWKEPNSVDVKNVANKKNIQFYISKYFGKNAGKGAKCNELDNEENSKNLRLWFCSRSLSRLKSVIDFRENWESIVDDVIETSGHTKAYINRWVKILYFKISDFVNRDRAIIEQVLKKYAHQQGYVPM